MSELVPVATQLRRVLAEVEVLPQQALPLAQAGGHRLARDLHAQVAVPPWDNSAMDGYALRADDVQGAGEDHPVTLQVVGDLPAGSSHDPSIGPGQAVRIMTGAAMPSQADAVVQLEHTNRTEPHAPLAQTVTIYRSQEAGGHIRYAGEDLKVGDRVAGAGRYVRATVAASLAATGHGTAWVHQRARVAVIATGAELVPPGQLLERGTIPDSNSVMVAGLAQEAGAEVVSVMRLDDQPQSLATHLEQVAEEADVIVLTGGVSAGAYDPVTRVFAGSGQVHFSKVAMQPGKPQAFGRYRDSLLFGLPGNPVSVWVSFQVFVRPALLVMQGAPQQLAVPTPRTGRARVSWSTPSGRDQYLPARLTPISGSTEYAVVPAAPRGSKSHLIGSLAAANGYAIVPADYQQVRPGDVLDVVLDTEENDD
ncbi:MAG TPA: gephyrin-like molybdotransferase Glp [Beutenbergiaceae bacterium]|nr:gephyrin-like molybdotransferase Glp [Beutenbergiaceae bacterium]